MRTFVITLIATIPFIQAFSNVSETQLTSQEQKLVDQKLQDFYQKQSDPSQMNQIAPKFLVEDGRQLTQQIMQDRKLKNATLVISDEKIKQGMEGFQGQISPLQRQAKIKATTRYQRHM
jgi:hypothetical protein